MDSELYGKKIEDISEVYKGDGVTTCKWCGDTGIMHTFSNDGYFYSDSFCFCSIGWEFSRKTNNGE
jgi:hypothetical protein